MQGQTVVPRLNSSFTSSGLKETFKLSNFEPIDLIWLLTEITLIRMDGRADEALNVSFDWRAVWTSNVCHGVSSASWWDLISGFKVKNVRVCHRSWSPIQFTDIPKYKVRNIKSEISFFGKEERYAGTWNSWQITDDYWLIVSIINCSSMMVLPYSLLAFSTLSTYLLVCIYAYLWIDQLMEIFFLWGSDNAGENGYFFQPCWF